MELLCPWGATFAQLRASALTGNQKSKPWRIRPLATGGWPRV